MPGFNVQSLKKKVRSAVGWGRDYRVNEAQSETISEAKAGAVATQAPSTLPTWKPAVWNGQDTDDQSLVGRAEPDARWHACGFVEWLQGRGFAGREIASEDLRALYTDFCQAHALTPRGWPGRGVGGHVGQLCGGQKPRRLIVNGVQRQPKVYTIPWASSRSMRRRA